MRLCLVLVSVMTKCTVRQSRMSDNSKCKTKYTKVNNEAKIKWKELNDSSSFFSFFWCVCVCVWRWWWLWCGLWFLLLVLLLWNMQNRVHYINVLYAYRKWTAWAHKLCERPKKEKKKGKKRAKRRNCVHRKKCKCFTLETS